VSAVATTAGADTTTAPTAADTTTAPTSAETTTAPTSAPTTSVAEVGKPGGEITYIHNAFLQSFDPTLVASQGLGRTTAGTRCGCR